MSVLASDVILCYGRLHGLVPGTNVHRLCTYYLHGFNIEVIVKHSRYCGVFHTGNLYRHIEHIEPGAAGSGRGCCVCPSLLGIAPGFMTSAFNSVIMTSVACITAYRK